MAYGASGIGANGRREISPNATKKFPGSDRLSPKTTSPVTSSANAVGASGKESSRNRTTTRRHGEPSVLLMAFIPGLRFRERRFARSRFLTGLRAEASTAPGGRIRKNRHLWARLSSGVVVVVVEGRSEVRLQDR